MTMFGRQGNRTLQSGSLEPGIARPLIPALQHTERLAHSEKYQETSLQTDRKREGLSRTEVRERRDREKLERKRT